MHPYAEINITLEDKESSSFLIFLSSSPLVPCLHLEARLYRRCISISVRPKDRDVVLYIGNIAVLIRYVKCSMWETRIFKMFAFLIFMQTDWSACKYVAGDIDFGRQRKQMHFEILWFLHSLLSAAVKTRDLIDDSTNKQTKTFGEARQGDGLYWLKDFVVFFGSLNITFFLFTFFPSLLSQQMSRLFDDT